MLLGKVRAILSLFLMFAVVGCAGLGDGQVDIVEGSILRIAVGSAMDTFPQSVAPAHRLADAVLDKITSDSQVPLSVLDEFVIDELQDIGLPDDEKIICLVFINEMRSLIIEEIGSAGGNPSGQNIIVINDIMEIVKTAAESRMVGD